MRFGFYAPNFGATGDPAFVVELALRVESAGWDGFFLWDHLVTRQQPVLDPWVALGAVASRTERIWLGPMIVPLARRRPQKVALEAATVASLAPGRFVLGVGLGVPVDFTSFGEDAHWRTRAAGVEEGLAFVREALPDLPVWVGGEWPRTQPFHGAARADGVFPLARDADDRFRPLTPDEVAAVLDSLPEPARADCALWSWNDPNVTTVEEYEAAGVTWWMAETWGRSRDELLSLAEGGPHEARAALAKR